MRSKFTHLSLMERELLFAWKEQRISFRVIATRLHRSHTTISREWKRNTKYFHSYIPCMAQKRYERISGFQRRGASLKNPFIFLYVRKHLADGWSPEQIAGRLSLDHPHQHIDDETIYRYIYSPRVRKEKLWRLLPLARKRRRRWHGRKMQRTGASCRLPFLTIDARPAEINDRKVFGHWETDNYIGTNKEKAVLSVTTERLTRFTILEKLAGKEAQHKTAALIDRLSRFPDIARKSITADNGFENYGHRTVSDTLSVAFYFAHPYSSWEKGTVENTNNRLRRYLPRGTMLTHISEAAIGKIEKRLNTTPRKCLGFKTPLEKLYEVLAQAGAMQTSWGGRFQVYSAGRTWFKGGTI
jgi:transposase, IS30 family